MSKRNHLLFSVFRRYICSVKKKSFVNEKHKQWNLDTKVK